MRQKSAYLLCLFLLISFSCTAQPEPEPAAPQTPAAPEPINLFDGQTLNGWNYFLVDPDVKMNEVWSVEEGLLVCKGEPMGYLYSEKEFTSFKLEVEWRWPPGSEPGNSGVLMRINGEPRALPRSIEAQLKAGSAGDVYGFHGMRIDGDPDRKIFREGHELGGDLTGVSKLEANEAEPGQWNKYEITFDGGDLTVAVNGKRTNEVFNCEVLAGPIGLQSEGGIVQFRTVRLTPID